MSPPGFYGRLARLAMRHRAITVLLVAVVSLIAGVSASRLKVDSDILSIILHDRCARPASQLHRDIQFTLQILSTQTDIS